MCDWWMNIIYVYKICAWAGGGIHASTLCTSSQSSRVPIPSLSSCLTAASWPFPAANTSGGHSGAWGSEARNELNCWSAAVRQYVGSVQLYSCQNVTLWFIPYLGYSEQSGCSICRIYRVIDPCMAENALTRCEQMAHASSQNSLNIW